MLNKIKNIFKKKEPVSKPADRYWNQRAYEMATLSRLVDDWNGMAQSANFDIKQGLNLIRLRARELKQNDPYATSFVKMLIDNIIGSDGFTMRVKAYDRVFTGKLIKDVPDYYANKLIPEEFWKWGKPKTAAITEDISFKRLCEIILETAAVDGEVFINKVRGKGVNKYGFTLQIIEAQYLDETYNDKLSNGNVVVMGVEVNKYRKVIAYHFFEDDPYYDNLSGRYIGKRNRIPAEQIIHLFYKERPNQLRGVSWYAPSALRLKMLRGFEEASIVNARAAAMTTGVLSPMAESDGKYTGSDYDDDGNPIEEMHTGQIYKVPKGFQFNTYDPKFPSDQHQPFVTAILRSVASGMGVSYNTLANDYSSVNYSSLRGSLLIERERWKSLQSWFIEVFLEPVYWSWIEMAILSGNLNLPVSKIEKFEPWFYGKRWDWVDPLKDSKAIETKIKNRLTTFTKVLAEQGIDIDEHLEELKEEREKFEAAGINYDLLVDEQPDIELTDDDEREEYSFTQKKRR
jgi:lambda family phage portal protein